MTSRYTPMLKGIKAALIADSNIDIPEKHIYIERDLIDISQTLSSRKPYCVIKINKATPMFHGMGGFLDIQIEFNVDVIIRPSKKDLDYTASKHSLLKSAYWIEQSLMQSTLDSTVEWTNYIGTELLNTDVYSGMKAIRCKFKSMIQERVTANYVNPDVNRLMVNGYTNAFKLLANVISNQADVTIPKESIFIMLDDNDFIPKCVNNYPSCLIKLTETLNRVNGTASKYSENDIGFSVVIVQNDSSQEYDYIGTKGIYENASGIERAIQFNPLISYLITEIYAGQTNPALYSGMTDIRSGALLQSNASNSYWTGSERIDDYQGYKAFKCGFVYKEQRGMI